MKRVESGWGTFLSFLVTLAPAAFAQAQAHDAGVADVVDAASVLDAAAPDTGEVVGQPPAVETVPSTPLEPTLPPGEPVIEVPPPPPGVIDISVRGDSAKQKMEIRSTESVQVVDLASERRQSADLAEVLARTNGISVRRNGGLGSEQDFSLGGLTGDQIRIYVDGLPIEFAGFGQGIGNLPIGLLQRVEIYRGVVPVRFGANALGGALNVVTRQPTRGTGGSTQLQLGSFGTARMSGTAHHVDARSGLLARASAYLDSAQNDYPVRVSLGQADGSTRESKAYRFHDAYRAFGGGIDVGFVRRPWAEKLILKVFASKRNNELQSDIYMSNPYGEVTYGGENYGTSLQYVQPLREDLKLEVLLGYGFRTLDFDDTSSWRYDWFGQRQRMIPTAGEINGTAIDQTIREHGVFARTQLEWRVARDHTLHLNISPSFTSRDGENKRNNPAVGADPLTATQNLFVMVSALEHVMELFDGRLENTLFGKSYLYSLHTSEPLTMGYWRDQDVTKHRFGIGDGLRVGVYGPLSVKLAYELATRIPRPDEVFGNGVRISSNFSLKPESSHNGNLSLLLDRYETKVGSFSAQAHGFVRATHNQIVPLGFSMTSVVYQNVFDATSRGVELIGRWLSPGEYFEVDGNMTYQSFRNGSGKGQYETFKGDRIPNQPYLFANASARGTLPSPFTDFDALSLTYYMRYVHSFYRSWESAGLLGTKATIPYQVSHSLALTYLVRKLPRTFSFSMEAQNITDALLFDNFGVQRPGRGYYAKVAADF